MVTLPERDQKAVIRLINSLVGVSGRGELARGDSPTIGADKNSEWSNGNLVIAANHGPIHLLQAAFYAVRLEVQRRKAAFKSGRR